MGCNLPSSITESTIPSMKQLSEMYKLYREIPLFSALYESMLELVKENMLPEALVPEIVHMYDQKIVETVKDSVDQYTIVGKLVMYRILNNHNWFVLSNVTVFSQPPPVNESSTKKSKKVAKMGKRLGKFDKIKIWALDPIPDSTFTEIITEGIPNPYLIELEKVQKVKVKKPKLETKKVKPEGYNPLIYTSLLGQKDEDLQNQDYLRPMPYNEKLRRARNNPDDVMTIAKSQVGTVDLLKGKFRKKMREYPYRCVEPASRRVVDIRVVSGRNIVKRQYMVLMRSQDRFLSEMTVSAGGSLALVAHNIHVADGVALGEDMDVVRESYGTRRKNKIEHSTFDTLKNYAVVEEPLKKRVETDTDSDLSEEETSDEEDVIPQLPIRNMLVKPESRCRPKSRQTDKNNSREVLNSIKGRSSENDTNVEVNESVKDVDEFLDGLVEMLDGNNNVEDALAVNELEIDENILTDDLLQSEVFDMFNSHQNILPAAGFSGPNQTLDLDTDS